MPLYMLLNKTTVIYPRIRYYHIQMLLNEMEGEKEQKLSRPSGVQAAAITGILSPGIPAPISPLLAYWQADYCVYSPRLTNPLSDMQCSEN